MRLLQKQVEFTTCGQGRVVHGSIVRRGFCGVRRRLGQTCLALGGDTGLLARDPTVGRSIADRVSPDPTWAMVEEGEATGPARGAKALRHRNRNGYQQGVSYAPCRMQFS